MRKTLTAIASAALLAGTFATPAAAVPVDYSFTYETDFSIDPQAEADIGFGIGSLLSGLLTVDTDLLDADGTGSDVAVDALSFSFGDFSFTNDDDLFGGAVVDFFGGSLQSIEFVTEFMAGDFFYSIELLQGLTVPEFIVTDGFSDLAGGPLVSAAEVPEPATAALLLAGLAGGVFARRRRQR